MKEGFSPRVPPVRVRIDRIQTPLIPEDRLVIIDADGDRHGIWADENGRLWLSDILPDENE